MAELRVGEQTIRINNVYCVARNFVAHAMEMGSVIANEPVVFIKPNSAVVKPGAPLVLPAWSNDVHHELELVVVIGEGGKEIAKDNALNHVAGYGLGLDLTARDVQALAKKNGAPWTLAKGFDGAAVLTDFVSAQGIDPTQQQFTLHINGELRQSADTRLMAFDVATLIAWISSKFTLQVGDVIYTGTPEGVGPIHSGDVLRLTWSPYIEQEFVVA